MAHQRLNAYRIMWLFVFFDLPVKTRREQKIAENFRKRLLEDGFTMMQLSVYIRHCPSQENANVHIQRVKRQLPSKGQVSILQVTDKQYGKIMNFWGKQKEPAPDTPQQLEFF